MILKQKPLLPEVGVISAVLLGLSGCAGPGLQLGPSEVTLNPSAIETRLQNEIELTSPGLIVDITPRYECPSVMRGQPGDSWICEGSFSQVTFDVRITLLDDSGRISIDPLL